ncbi:putative ATPase [Rhodopirellula rubra]|uniref:Putative ATPase n=1 Tax=Aporhodopirellula rubra TaxID=980271 RepID=A0A7W5H352_9BACT|nr:AAA family ATPase [Aporhodopirellula rubra]MBB3204907.1 putative ATPase [Aporhodopirellula rubra]
MKIKVKNLGPIRQAEFEVGELTTICGMNNTGKTYITHAMYGFLDYFHNGYSYLPLDLSRLEKDGQLTVDLEELHAKRNSIAARASKEFSRRHIGQVFGAAEGAFDDTEIIISGLAENRRLKTLERKTKFGSADKAYLQLEKKSGSTKASISLLQESDSEESLPIPLHLAGELIGEALKDIVFDRIIPKPFISSAERTGAAIFQKELDFTRNRLIEVLGDKSNKLRPYDLFSHFKGTYPVAVRKNVDFIRELSSIVDRKSFLLDQHTDFLAEFSDLIGGEYAVNRDGDVQFLPASRKRVKLSLVESSSSVRSLLDIGFYLRHIAAPGDLLVVDEPELNLHPSIQRRFARLLARLVNLDIQVFLTTHSDYIIREFNTLLMLNESQSRHNAIMEREGYSTTELLKVEQVRSYFTEERTIKLDDRTNRKKCLTLTSAQIDQKQGIEIKSFDTTIDFMNRIQDEVMWGGNE